MYEAIMKEMYTKKHMKHYCRNPFSHSRLEACEVSLRAKSENGHRQRPEGSALGVHCLKGILI